MTAAELRLLRILGLELITNTIEQLDVALLGVLLEGRNERPRHGSCSLARDVCVLPVIILHALARYGIRTWMCQRTMSGCPCFHST